MAKRKKPKWEQELGLTWLDKTNRWTKTKQINGKRKSYYLNYPYSVEGGRQAWKAWKELEKEIIANQQSDVELPDYFVKAIDNRKMVIRWYELEGTPDEPIVDRMRQEIDRLNQLAGRAIMPTRSEIWKSGLSIDLIDVQPFRPIRIEWLERFDAVKLEAKWHGNKETEKSIEHNVKSYLDNRGDRVDDDEAAVGTWAATSSHIRYFGEWFGMDKSVEDINEQTLELYAKHMRACMKDKKHKIKSNTIQLKDKKYSSRAAEGHYKDLLAFLKWLHRTRRRTTELPLNIDDRELHITIQSNAATPFDQADIPLLLDKIASDQTKLFILLALNCGMLQKDIADLRQDEVDWNNGTIKRYRSKLNRRSKTNKDIPQVEYPLWHETFELLLKHRSAHPEYVLLNQDGNPLQDIGKIKNKDGVERPKNNCAITNRWKRLHKKHGLPKELTFRSFRKTGSVTLDNHPIYKTNVLYYTADSLNNTTDKSYKAPTAKEFMHAVSYLGTQFGMKKLVDDPFEELNLNPEIIKQMLNR